MKRAVLILALTGRLFAQVIPVNGSLKVIGTIQPLTDTIANKPATCVVGQVYFATDAAAGGNLYLCTTTNNWLSPNTTKINGTALSGLATGILKNTTTTGVPSIAVAADFPATTLATGTSGTLVAPRQYYVCTGTCTVTPPVPAAGYEFCIRNGNNVSTVVTLAALGSSARYEVTAGTSYGTAGTGTFISGGAVGDKMCLVGLDSTHYLVGSFTGTWVAN